MALFALMALVIAVLGVVGVRVKQAVGKKQAVAKERESVASAQVKEPLRAVTPVGVAYRPRIDFTGTLKPWKEADLGFETPGRLAGIRVAVGDVVKAGAVLAVLDASRAGAQVTQANSQIGATQASLAIAEDNLARTEKLVASHAVPEAQLEQAKQQVALARAQVAGANATAQVARTGAGQHALIAPFGGIITRAPTGIGGIVNPGAPILRLEDTSKFRLSATVGEEDMPMAVVGAPVRVTYRDQVVTGRVIAVVPSLDQMTRRAPVEIEVPNDAAKDGKPGLIAWGFVRASIEGQTEARGLKIPPKAHRPGAQSEVVLAVNGKAQMVRVSRVESEDGSWIVTHGLRETDKVIVAPPAELADGDPVTVSD